MSGLFGMSGTPGSRGDFGAGDLSVAPPPNQYQGMLAVVGNLSGFRLLFGFVHL